MSKGSKPPQAPDPRVVAGAQTQQNRDSAGYNAALNRIDTYSPAGSQEYTNTGIDPTTGAPMYRQDIKLDPQLEQLYRGQLGQNQQLQGAEGNLVSQIGNMQPFSLSGLPNLPTNYDDLRKSQGDALYNQQAAFLDPQFKQGEDALRSRMANQGIVEGTEAYTNAMGDFNRGKEFSYGQARDKAITGAGQEADRAFGMQSQARNQMMSELLTQRGVPMQELAGLRSMTGVNLPQFGETVQVGSAPADITSAMNNQYQGQVDAYNAKQQSKNANLQTAASIAAMFMLSDERAKDNIEPIGELNDGTGLFSFTYKGSDAPQVGVMAQEVEKRDPAAVRTRPDGLKEVNYSRVLAQALRAA
jgi:hypothetical protein